MLGAVDADRIRVWVRSSEAATLTLQVSATPDFADRRESSGTSDESSDFTAVLTVDCAIIRRTYADHRGHDPPSLAAR
jgi:hypothetical protein